MVHVGDLSENMTVRALGGEELGRIIRIEEDGFLVEEGISFLGDTLVPIALVSEVRDGDVFLALAREELERERGRGGARSPLLRRTLGQESAGFVHEGDELGVGGARAPDNLREGGGPSPSSERSRPV